MGQFSQLYGPDQILQDVKYLQSQSSHEKYQNETIVKSVSLYST